MQNKCNDCGAIKVCCDDNILGPEALKEVEAADKIELTMALTKEHKRQTRLWFQIIEGIKDLMPIESGDAVIINMYVDSFWEADGKRKET